MTTANSRLMLIADDEPEYLEFIFDLAESLGVKVDVAEDVPTALRLIRDKAKRYDAVLVDMSIPDQGGISQRIQSQHPIVGSYPGIALAIEARTAGYGPSRVVAYTVHDDDAIEQTLAKIGVRYVLKGRPSELREVLGRALGVK